MSAIDQLLENAERYAAEHASGELAAAPARKVAVVACMDARLNPYELLGLEPGDAHVIGNAGGVVTDDEIRSLAISQHLLGTEEVMLIHHTDCGMLSLRDEEFAAQLEEHAGVRPPWDPHGFDDLEADLRKQVSTLRASPFLLHKDAIRGFIFDVGSGRLREIDV